MDLKSFYSVINNPKAVNLVDTMESMVKIDEIILINQLYFEIKELLL